jgi:hypothetical protein
VVVLVMMRVVVLLHLVVLLRVQVLLLLMVMLLLLLMVVLLLLLMVMLLRMVMVVLLQVLVMVLLFIFQRGRHLNGMNHGQRQPPPTAVVKPHAASSGRHGSQCGMIEVMLVCMVGVVLVLVLVVLLLLQVLGQLLHDAGQLVGIWLPMCFAGTVLMPPLLRVVLLLLLLLLLRVVLLRVMLLLLLLQQVPMLMLAANSLLPQNSACRCLGACLPHLLHLVVSRLQLPSIHWLHHARHPLWLLLVLVLLVLLHAAIQNRGRNLFMHQLHLLHDCGVHSTAHVCRSAGMHRCIELFCCHRPTAAAAGCGAAVTRAVSATAGRHGSFCRHMREILREEQGSSMRAATACKETSKQVAPRSRCKH